MDTHPHDHIMEDLTNQTMTKVMRAITDVVQLVDSDTDAFNLHTVAIAALIASATCRVSNIDPTKLSLQQHQRIADALLSRAREGYLRAVTQEIKEGT